MVDFTGDGLGEWVKCDDGWIGVESYRDYHFFDTPNFNIESTKTVTLAVRLCIKIKGNLGSISTHSTYVYKGTYYIHMHSYT